MNDKTAGNKKQLEQLEELIGSANFSNVVKHFAGKTLYFSK